MRVKSSVIYECGKLQAQLNTTGRKKMPRGKGTYGSKVGRPPKKSKKKPVKKGMSRRKMMKK
jgi:hypothetical protein